MSGVSRLGGADDPIGAERLAAQRAQVEPTVTRPTTGADGTVYRWWQFLGGLLGWGVAAFLVWYFGRGGTVFGWQLTALIVLCAVALGVFGSYLAVEVLRPAVLRKESRNPAEPREPPARPLDIDRLGRVIVGVDSLRSTIGELVVQFDRDGAKWFVPAAELERWRRDHQDSATPADSGAG